MMSVDQYESLVGQISQLQGNLAHIWAALEAPSGADEPILLPTPDGGRHMFQPRPRSRQKCGMPSGVWRNWPWRSASEPPNKSFMTAAPRSNAHARRH